MGERFFLLVCILVLVSGGCTRVDVEQYQIDSVSAATARKGPPARVLLGKLMPEAMADGMVKIAVLVNLRAGDQSRQFIEGCVW